MRLTVYYKLGTSNKCFAFKITLKYQFFRSILTVFLLQKTEMYSYWPAVFIWDQSDENNQCGGVAKLDHNFCGVYVLTTYMYIVQYLLYLVVNIITVYICVYLLMHGRRTETNIKSNKYRILHEWSFCIEFI